MALRPLTALRSPSRQSQHRHLWTARPTSWHLSAPSTSVSRRLRMRLQHARCPATSSRWCSGLPAQAPTRSSSTSRSMAPLPVLVRRRMPCHHGLIHSVRRAMCQSRRPAGRYERLLAVGRRRSRPAIRHGRVVAVGRRHPHRHRQQRPVGNGVCHPRTVCRQQHNGAGFHAQPEWALELFLTSRCCGGKNSQGMESNHRYTVLQTAALTTWLPWDVRGLALSPASHTSGVIPRRRRAAYGRGVCQPSLPIVARTTFDDAPSAVSFRRHDRP
jgi:hypothetical protein